MRVAVLWNALSGYLSSCLKELAKDPANEVFVSRRVPVASAPYDEGHFSWIKSSYTYSEHPNVTELLVHLRRFAPDLLIVASWNRPQYRRVCREFRGRALRVCCMDNQWRGTAKQWLGVFTAPLYVQNLFDGAFVAGERQADFARRLGFSDDRIWRGFLSCDHPRFHAVWAQNPSGIRERREFLYVGRLSAEKGIETLINGYRKYRSASESPWQLRIAGAGPLTSWVRDEPDVEYDGFVQPDEVPLLFSRAGCFVLPSSFEQWGVALHEATASGLPVICSTVCGASVHLLQDGYNGYLFPPNDPEALATAMSRVSQLSPDTLAEMSAASVRQSWQFTPERWARYVQERCRELGIRD